MYRLTRSKVQPIGLDIGTDAVRMLQLHTDDVSPRVGGYLHMPLPEEAIHSPQLRLPLACELIPQMLRHGGFQGREVVAALPRDIVQVKNLRLPMMPVSELASAVAFEARGIFPFNDAEARIDYLYAGEVRQGGDSRHEVIVLGALLSSIESFVEILHNAGVELASLDFEPCAIYRGIERFIRRREDEQEVHVLVDVGVNRTQVIIGRGREISFLKSIEIGAARLNNAVAQSLGITYEEGRTLRRRLTEAQDASTDGSPGGSENVRQTVHDVTRGLLEELAREISLCLRYHSVTFRGQRPTRVRVLGGEANDPQVITVLGSALSVPVEPGRPLFSTDISNLKPHDRRGSLSAWGTALGLGLKRVRNTFAARDGKSRSEPIVQPLEPSTPSADAREVLHA